MGGGKGFPVNPLGGQSQTTIFSKFCSNLFPACRVDGLNESITISAESLVWAEIGKYFIHFIYDVKCSLRNILDYVSWSFSTHTKL